MTPSSYPEQLKTVRTLAQVIRQQHLNHEWRNERLSTLRALIENFMASRRSYDDVNVHHKIDGHTNLRILLELAVWKLEHETHTCVKTRLRLLEETVDFFLGEYDKALTEEREKRAVEYRLERIRHEGVGDFTVGMTITETPDDGDHPS